MKGKIDFYLKGFKNLTPIRHIEVVTVLMSFLPWCLNYMNLSMLLNWQILLEIKKNNIPSMIPRLINVHGAQASQPNMSNVVTGFDKSSTKVALG